MCLDGHRLIAFEVPGGNLPARYLGGFRELFLGGYYDLSFPSFSFSIGAKVVYFQLTTWTKILIRDTSS